MFIPLLLPRPTALGGGQRGGADQVYYVSLLSWYSIEVVLRQPRRSRCIVSVLGIAKFPCFIKLEVVSALMHGVELGFLVYID